MIRKLLPAAAILFLVALGSPSPIQAVHPVVAFAAVYLSEKLLVDDAWDQLTGRPNVKLLEQRLRELENNGALRSEVRDEVRKLRDSIDNRVTRDEFRKMVERTTAEIGIIQRRLDDLEERVEKLEVENEDIKNKTRNAASGQFFQARAERFMKDGNVQRAISCYSLAVRLEPNMIAAHQGRCGIYKQQRAWGVVVFETTDAIEKCGNLERVWFYRERAYANSELGKTTETVEDCSKVLETSPEEVAIRRLRAVHGHKAAKSVEARMFYGGEFFAGDPPDLVRKRNQFAQTALADFNEVVRLDPKLAGAFFERADLYMSVFRDQPRALSDLGEAIRLNPNKIDYLVRRGQIYEAGRYGNERQREKAIEDFTAAHKLDPKDASILCWRAQCHTGPNRIDLKIADYEHAFRIDPPTAALSLSSIYILEKNDLVKGKYYRDQHDQWEAKKAK